MPNSPALELLIHAHQRVVTGVMRLMDGLLEDADIALFELADRAQSEDETRRCFDLARELRNQRQGLLGSLHNALQRSMRLWEQAVPEPDQRDAIWRTAKAVSKKAHVHFGFLLKCIQDECSERLGRAVGRIDELPISPSWIAFAYVHARSIPSLSLAASSTLDRLFVRYVIERMGPIYGSLLVDLKSEYQPRRRADGSF